jgi:alkanesulfonate monooxygenase SsuD/methylene tetrahydromethanopterin reductase-like flavin-dependent oxidoreductase (luciferase family)
VRLGVVILPDAPWSEAAGRWRRAEELGLDHAWTYDHIAWRSLQDKPWFAAVPTVTAAALITSRIRLGPLVASPNFRHPVPLARELLALDDVSGGRFTLGIGAGGTGWDATILGQDPWSPSERATRFEEFVALTDALLRQASTDHDGRYYSARDAAMHPGCVQQPRIPFAVAATGSRGMRVAARHAQTWVSNGDRSHTGPPMPAERGAAVIKDQRSRLDDACAEMGRDPQSIATLVLTDLYLDAGLDSVEQFRDTIGRYAEVGVTDLVVHWPRAEGPFTRDQARFEEAVTTARS